VWDPLLSPFFDSFSVPLDNSFPCFFVAPQCSAWKSSQRTFTLFSFLPPLSNFGLAISPPLSPLLSSCSLVWNGSHPPMDDTPVLPLCLPFLARSPTLFLLFFFWMRLCFGRNAFTIGPPPPTLSPLSIFPGPPWQTLEMPRLS